MRATAMRTLAAGTGVLISAVGLAQPGQPPMSPNLARQMMQQQRPETGPMVSVDFKGGTLQEFATALRASTSEPVNISLQGDAAAVTVEPMSLRNVSVESALRGALGARINQNQFLPDGSSVIIKFDQVQSGPSDSPVYVVTRSPGVEFRGGMPQSTIDVISIQRLVGGDQPLTPDIVLSAIDAGLSLQDRGETPRPDIKFHRDSGLLLVHGNPAHVSLVDEIIKRMMSDHDRVLSESGRRRAASIERGADMKRAQIRIRLADAESHAAQQRLDMVKKLVDQGQESPTELANATLAVQRAEGEHDMAMIELDRLKQQEDAGVSGEKGNPSGDGEGAVDPRDQKIKALEARISDLEAELGKTKQGGAKKPTR